MTDGVLIAAGAIYLITSLMLFVLGTNLSLLAILVVVRDPKGKTRRNAPSMVDALNHASIDLTEPDHASLPTVTVQLPIYNELYVAERAIRAVAAMDYPAELLQIQVLDDSDDETATLIAQVVTELGANGLDIVHVQRTDRTGYKAGALGEGMRSATGELIAIFDADFVPPAEFLTETVPHFSDPDIGFVQCRWGHINADYSWMTRLQSLAIDGHFMVEQAARGLRNYWFNFNGTAGIWRAATIEDAGGWTADTLTEDLDLSYRAHLKGWRGHYREDVVVPGELPAQMSSFRRQQHRWARGSLECAKKLLSPVWRSEAPFATKFQATAHLTAYSIHLMLFTLALIYPLVVQAGARFQGFSTLYGVGYVFALSSLSPGIFFIAGQRRLGQSWWRRLPRIITVTILGAGMMVNTLRAAIQIFTHPNPEFERTAKFGLAEPEAVGRSWTHKRYQLSLDRIVYVEMLLAFYCWFGAWTALSHRNWGIALYATVFGLGLFAIASATIGQTISVYRSRERRAGTVAAERSALLVG